MKKFLGAAILVLITASEVRAADYTIKLGYIGSESHPTMTVMKEVFAKQIEEGSEGKIKVELYPNGQLGGDRELCEGVQLGAIQMAIPSSSVLAGFEKRIQALDLPYLFTTREAAFAAVDGVLGEKLNALTAEKGILILGYQENGFRHVTNSRKPIRTPDDMKGLKIRTMENPMHIAFFKALGANPTPMSWGELYTALQQGTVDAQENPYAMIDDGKFYEVQKYVSETGHVFSFEVLIANKAFVDGLPEALRDLVLKAAKDATEAQRKAMAEEEESFKRKVTEAGMSANALTAEEKKPFVEATAEVYPQFADELGQDLMEIIRQVQK